MLALAAAISAESSGRAREEHLRGAVHKLVGPWRGESIKAQVTIRAHKLKKTRRRRAALVVRCIPEESPRMMSRSCHMLTSQEVLYRHSTDQRACSLNPRIRQLSTMPPAFSRRTRDGCQADAVLPTPLDLGRSATLHGPTAFEAENQFRISTLRAEI